MIHLSLESHRYTLKNKKKTFFKVVQYYIKLFNIVPTCQLTLMIIKCKIFQYRLLLTYKTILNLYEIYSLNNLHF